MTGETFEEPSFQFIPTEQPSSDLFFQFAFEESTNLVELPTDEIIPDIKSTDNRISRYLKGLGMFLIIGFLTLSYSGLIKQELQTNRANAHMAQLSISNPIDLLTSFYKPAAQEAEKVEETQDLGLAFADLSTNMETVNAEVTNEEAINEESVKTEIIADETISESTEILEKVELKADENNLSVKSFATSFTEEKKPVLTSVIEKKKNIVKPRSIYSSAERDYKVRIASASYKANKLQAAREDKYLLLTFSASWCMPCKVMEETVFKDPQVVEHLDEHFIKMKVDIDDFDGINLKQHFKVSAIPTFIMLNRNDEIVGRYSKSMSTEKMLSVLKNYR